MSEGASSSPAYRLAQEVTDKFAKLDEVEAIALGGSQTSRAADTDSDIDLYVYCRARVSLEARRGIASGAGRAEIGNEFWEPGDEWIDRDTRISVDVMFRDVKWIEDRLDDVLVRHRASVGYSTCFWYNVRNSQTLFDRQGWFAALKQKADQPYPQEMKRAIIAKNFPILRRNISSYIHQIELAIARGDVLSIHHRTTAFLASYFDILFAVNEHPHPGEKQLIERARAICTKLPENFPRGVEELIRTSAGPERSAVGCANALVDGLEALLVDEGLLSGVSAEVSARGIQRNANPKT